MGASAATAATVGGTAIAMTAASVGASMAMSGGSKTPDVLMPKAPAITTSQDKDAIAAAEKKKLRQGASARTTLMTGPQGLLEPAPVSRKALLGE